MLMPLLTSLRCAALWSAVLLLSLPVGLQATDFAIDGSGPPTMTVGIPATFNIILDNTSQFGGGPFTPDENFFEFNIPVGWTVNSTSLPDGTCTQENDVFVCMPPPVPAGQTTDFDMTLVSMLVGNATLRFEAETNLADPNPNKNFIDLNVDVSAPSVPDLWITKTASAETVTSGDSLTFTLTVEAFGRTFLDVVVRDPWPVELEFASAQIGDGTNITRSCAFGLSVLEPRLQCTLGTVEPGEVVVITVRAIARTALNTVNIATVESQVPDDIPDNNSSSVGIDIIPRTGNEIDLAVRLFSDQLLSGNTSRPLGTQLTLTVNLTNHGPETATGITLVQRIAAALGPEAKATIPEEATCSPGDGALTCTIDAMAPGTVLTFTYQNTLREPGTVILEAEATAQGPEDYRPGNNTANEGLGVLKGIVSQQVNLTSAPADVVLDGADPVTVEAGAATPAGCAPSDPILCLNNDRFQTQVEWRIPGTTDALGNLDAELTPGFSWFLITQDAANARLLAAIENQAYAGETYRAQDTFFNNTPSTIQIQPIPAPDGFAPLIIPGHQAGFPGPEWPDGTPTFEVLNGDAGVYNYDPAGNLVVINEAPPGKGIDAFEVFIIDAGGTRIDTPDVTAAEADRAGTPTGYALHANYPNPFNPQTHISYTLAAPAQVRLAVYSVTGRRVQTLVDAALPAGTHTAAWAGVHETGHAAASGVYFYRLEAGAFTATRKMLLMK